MKLRKYFVSNSSSSSFICEICGESSYGYDWNYAEGNKVTCENGHVFCDDHALVDISDIDVYNVKVPAVSCPVCMRIHHSGISILVAALEEIKEDSKDGVSRYIARKALETYRNKS